MEASRWAKAAPVEPEPEPEPAPAPKESVPQFEDIMPVSGECTCRVEQYSLEVKEKD